MRIHARFFAILRDRAGVSEFVLDLPADAGVVDALAAIEAKYPAIKPFIGRSAVAVNETYVTSDTLLSEGDELALIPPVSGG